MIAKVPTYDNNLIPGDNSTNINYLIKLVKDKYKGHYTKFIDSYIKEINPHYDLFELLHLYDLNVESIDIKHKTDFNKKIISVIETDPNNINIKNKYITIEELLNNSRDEFIFCNGRCYLITNRKEFPGKEIRILTPNHGTKKIKNYKELELILNLEIQNNKHYNDNQLTILKQIYNIEHTKYLNKIK